MADIHKRKTRGGKTFYQLRYKDADGEYAYKSYPTKKEAELERSRVSVELDAGIHMSKRRSLTIDEALDQWLWQAEHRGVQQGRGPVGETTLEDYKRRADLLRPVCGTIKLSDLTARGMNIIANQLLATMPSDDTAKRCLQGLKMALGVARSNDQMLTNPGEKVHITVKKTEEDRVLVPEPSEVAAMLNMADELARSPHRQIADAWHRYSLMIEVLASTGLRPSEVFGMPRKSLSVHNGDRFIFVRQKADKNRKIGGTKSKAGRRVLTIDQRLANRLAAWLDTKVAPDPDTLVFGYGPASRSQPASNFYRDCWRVLQEKCAFMIPHPDDPKSTINKYTLYSLRHFFATLQIMRGHNMKKVQVAMGHSDASLTWNTYVDTFQEVEARNDLEGSEKLREFMDELRATAPHRKSAQILVLDAA